MSEIHLPHDHNHDKNHEKTLARVAAIEDFTMTADVFKQLGDGSRLRIFWLLCHCEDCVLNISAMVNMSSPAVSHHLKQLKSAGLITCRRSGKEMYYKAADTKQSKLLHTTIEQLMEIICPQD
ncbi:metalloregulator ArsR/SmtB family transcription factor [Eubacterium sp. MSJ-13]|uniref:ArsR/SmtB family transcription factor n=1 Tax=Eubacterium sp. MSJ-13 TaxID=2841513 RepID=UPI001C0F9BE6|nr:metalloregulator ArsR/SmtB family transcription factor [Eubacterium sp. MSJ-13]MBU5477882.1 metalloregulator ArsR/SmtB family transcription factor [Eubacterium sp. MSJ-13]